MNTRVSSPRIEFHIIAPHIYIQIRINLQLSNMTFSYVINTFLPIVCHQMLLNQVLVGCVTSSKGKAVPVLN
jgi:hypothetical protein